MKVSTMSDRVIEERYDCLKLRCNGSILVQEIESIIRQEIELPDKYGLEELHRKVTVDKVNSLRINCFRLINEIKDWKEKILEIISPEIQCLIGPDIAIQRQLNLSIQMPNDMKSILEPHKDYRSGDSPFQKVVWVAITDSYGSNAMVMERGNQLESVAVRRGEAIIFDPNTQHGNKCNETKHTRISINVRVKNWFTPDLGEIMPDRQFGEYYEDLCFSKSTLRAFEIVRESFG